MYEAVWGNGSTQVYAGSIGFFATRQQAQCAADGFLERHADNPAVGAWVRPCCDESPREGQEGEAMP